MASLHQDHDTIDNFIAHPIPAQNVNEYFVDNKPNTNNHSNITYNPYHTPAKDDDYWDEFAFDLQNGTAGVSWSEKEIQEHYSSKCNDNKYTNTMNGLENRMFDTIDMHGGDRLKRLCEFTADGLYNRRGYIVLRGPNHDKKVILNVVMSLIVSCWKNKRTGETLDSNTMKQYLKTLFGKFKNECIEYNFKTDFNKDGEFHGILNDSWKAASKHNRLFGTGSKQSQFDWEGDAKIRDAITSGWLNPYTSLDNLQMIMCYIFGHFFYYVAEVRYINYNGLKSPLEHILITLMLEKYVQLEIIHDKVYNKLSL